MTEPPVVVFLDHSILSRDHLLAPLAAIAGSSAPILQLCWSERVLDAFVRHVSGRVGPVQAARRREWLERLFPAAVLFAEPRDMKGIASHPLAVHVVDSFLVSKASDLLSAEPEQYQEPPISEADIATDPEVFLAELAGDYRGIVVAAMQNLSPGAAYDVGASLPRFYKALYGRDHPS